MLFKCDFESGVLNDAAKQKPSQGWKQAGTMPEITQEHALAGKYAMKAYLNKNTSPTPYRTMLQTAWDTTSDPANQTDTHARFFEDSWIGFGIYLPSKGPGNWQQASTNYEILAQWHDAHRPFPPPSWDKEESKNPLFSLSVTSKPNPPTRHWKVNFLGESKTPWPILGSPRPWHYESSKSFDLGPIDADLDKWTTWVIRIRWNFWKVGSTNNKANWEVGWYDNVAGSPKCGLVQVWKNGKLVVDQSPIQVEANDNAGPAFSVGLYKGWRTQATRDADHDVTDRLMYFDEFRYGGKGASFADVSHDRSQPAKAQNTGRP